MSHRFHIPPGISADEWDRLSPFGRMLVEAGMYHDTFELLPLQLYVEHLISKVDLKDLRHPGHAHNKDDLPRMELKMFLQFLRWNARSEYARRVCAVAEVWRMELSLDEDGASLFMEQERREREAAKIS
jgi:hypothetical protein